MKDELHRMVYLSRNDISGDEQAFRSEITQILRAARKNNVKEDVTGALMFNAKVFAQVLEGPYDKVQGIFNRIESDERHSEVVILDFSPIEERGFPEWSMAYVGVESDLADSYFMIAEETNFNPKCLSGDQIFEVLLANLDESDQLSELNKAA